MQLINMQNCILYKEHMLSCYSVFQFSVFLCNQVVFRNYKAAFD